MLSPAKSGIFWTILFISYVNGSSSPWMFDNCENKLFERITSLDGYLYKNFNIGTSTAVNDLTCVLDCFYHKTCMSVVYASPQCHMYFAPMDASYSKEAETGTTYIQLEVTDHCASSSLSCHANALLVNGREDCACACAYGYDGDGAACDVNECIFETDNCDSNAVCANIVNSFTCTCNPGYDGDGTTCTDIDECSTGAHTCHVNADCTNTVGSYTCTCQAMYQGDGFECSLKNIRGETCTVDSDCIRTNFICSSGSCDCDLSFSYDIKTNECVDKCDDYGTQFTMQSTPYCLTGNNDGKYAYTTVDKCAELCVQITSFTCRTFEVWSGYCWFSASIKSDRPASEWDPWTGCQYYQRHCAVPS